MPEPNNFTFDFQELARILIKQAGIREGLWGIYIEFGFGAANVKSDPTSTTLAPATINIVQKIGIQQFDKPSNLTVDAAEVNPPPKTMSSKKRPKKGAK